MILVTWAVGAFIRKLQEQAEARRLVLRMQQAAVSEAANYILPHLVEATPRGATALLRQSTTITYSSDRTRALVGPTGAPSLYAGFVEYGTRPHIPPFDPISYWVARKLGLPMGSAANRRRTFGIMFSMGRKGTKAKRYVQNTWRRHGPNAQIFATRAAERELARWQTS